MSAQMQEQQPETLQKQNSTQKKSLWKPALIIIIIIAAIAFLVVWIMSSLGSIPVFWATIISAVLVVVPIVISLIGPVVSRDKPIVVQVEYPPPPPLPPQPPAPGSISYRDIIGLPPPTDVKAIQQREQAVEDIYTQLSQPTITALVLTGIGGAGKSTLAALVYEYTEKQRRKGACIFQDTPVWLTVNESVTMADLAGTLSEALGKPVPDVGNLPPARQAVALFNALNTVDKPCLIVIDQFENLLDWQTGHALAERPGVGEWLDAINSRQCHCRILLTSRPWPQGTRAFPATCMQEYHVGSMTTPEGIELLRKQGITGTDEELSKAVKHCEGHPFALILLASLLRNHNLSLSAMFKEPVHPMYVQLWSGDIAHNLLDLIFTKQLNETQRSLLLAFSIYREAVPLGAAQALMAETPDVPKLHTQDALNVLLAQHLLNALGEGRYRLHAIVANYAQDHFNERDEQANQDALRAAHAKAAQYYQQQAAKICPLRPQRKRISDVYPFIEAVWHLCRAAQWQAAYDTLEQEYLFNDLNRWGGNAILLEIYQLLEPSDEWHPQPAEESDIYDCLGRIYRVFGKMNEARTSYEEALHIRREAKDRDGEGTILNNLGGVYNALGKKEEALKYYEQALDIYREVGNRGWEGTTLNNLGLVYDDLGKKEEALKYFEQALAIGREVGNRSVEGTTLNNLGLVYNDLGKKEEALKYYEQALDIYREVGNRGWEGTTLNNLGAVYDDLGKKEEALKYLEQALAIEREVGDRGMEGKTLNNLGEVYRVLGKQEEALKYLEQALAIEREVGDRGMEGTTLNNLGEVYDDLGKKEEALKYFEQALGILREVGDRSGEGITLHNIGTLYFAKADYPIALACFLLARSIFEEVQSPNHDVVQIWIDRLGGKVGEEQFASLLAQVEPRAAQIVEQSLHKGDGL